MTTWNFDTSHSGIHFTVRHMVIAKVRGSFDRWQGTLEFDEENPLAAKIAVRIEAGSIDTRDAKRDAHLASPDFFDVEKYPELAFESTKVEKAGRGYRLAGNLTLHGVTRPVALEVESLGVAKDPWGNDRIAFSAETSINRKDYGLTWNQALETGGVLVGETVEITLDVQAVRAAAKAA